MSSLSLPSVPSVSPASATSVPASAAHPLRPVLITVLAAKIAVSVVLLATISFAPPVSAGGRYLASLN